MRGMTRWAIGLALAAMAAAGPMTARAVEPEPASPAPARDCLPPPVPPEEPGPDPLAQAMCHYVRGRVMMTNQETVLAAEEFRQAASLVPGVQPIWRNLGLAQYYSGRVTEAVQSLDHALELDPVDEATLYFRAHIATSQNDHAAAADLLGRLLAAAKKGSPYHILGTYHLARTRHSQGDVDGAIAAYESLFDLLATPESFFQRYPELFLIYRSQLKLRQNLGRLLLDRGQTDKAIAVLGEAIDSRPTNVDLLSLMCTAYLQKKDFAAAREWAQKVIESHPAGAEGYQRLAEVYKAEGKPSDAIPDLARYHQEHPDNRMLAFQLAAAYEAAGRKDEAAALYRDLSASIEKTPGTSVAAALKLAEIHVQDDQPIQAIEALASTLVGEVAESAILVRAAKLIDGLDDPAQVYLDAQRLVADNVTHYGPFLLVGMLAEVAKRPADAITLYDKAIARQSKAAIAYSRKADLLIRAGRHDQALNVYTAAVSAGLNLPVFRRRMGMLLEQLGRFDEALAEYRLVRKAAPGDKPTAYLLAEALVRKGEFDEAETELRALLKTYPGDLQAYSQLASLYLTKDDLAAAENVGLEAQGIQPDAVEPKGILAEVRYRQKRYDDALVLCREVLAAQPDALGVRLMMAYALAGKKQVADAVKEVRALLAAQPENIGWRYLLSGLYTEMGDQAAAEQELTLILRTKPDHAPSNNDLGYLWAERGVNLTRAEALIRQALAAEPKSAAYLDSLGWVMYKQGRFADAIGTLEEATRLAPELDPILWDHLGDSYWQLKRPDDAVKAWQTAARILDARGDEARPQDVKRVKDKLKRLQAGGTPDISPVVPGQEPNPRLDLQGTLKKSPG